MLKESTVRKGHMLLLPWLHKVLRCCVTREEKGLGASKAPQKEKGYPEAVCSYCVVNSVEVSSKLLLKTETW